MIDNKAIMEWGIFKIGEILAFWLYIGCMCATKADVGKLANPAWSKPNQQTRTELCT
jgi:hypothetical protein